MRPWRSSWAATSAHGGWNDGSYALFLTYGYLVAADARIGEALQRQWRPAMAFAVLLFMTAGPLFAAAAARGDPFTDIDPLSVTFRLIKSVDGWLWVVAILGLARSPIAHRPKAAARRPSAGRIDRASAVNRLGAYANDAVLPFYVLHETVIVVIAFFVLSWRIGAGAQYVSISLASLAATLLLYDLGVRRTRITRFLFGLKPKRRTLPPNGAHEVFTGDLQLLPPHPAVDPPPVLLLGRSLPGGAPTDSRRSADRGAREIGLLKPKTCRRRWCG